MFKVISRTSLIQNVPIVKEDGNEVVSCLPPRGSIFTRRITPALQYLMDNKQISIVESNENLHQNVNTNSSTAGTDNGSFSENMNITEFNSQEEKEKFQSKELNDESSPSSVEDKPRRGRKKKKTDGGDT